MSAPAVRPSANPFATPVITTSPPAAAAAAAGPQQQHQQHPPSAFAMPSAAGGGVATTSYGSPLPSGPSPFHHQQRDAQSQAAAAGAPYYGASTTPYYSHYADAYGYASSYASSSSSPSTSSSSASSFTSPPGSNPNSGILPTLHLPQSFPTSAYASQAAAVMSPQSLKNNPFALPPTQSSSWSGYYTPLQQQSGHAAGALVVYGSNLSEVQGRSLLGLYYDERVHGPWAAGDAVNPFTPGLGPISSKSSSSTTRPAYAIEDPVRELFPASSRCAASDPLNWITAEIMADVRTKVDERAADRRAPLKSISARM